MTPDQLSLDHHSKTPRIVALWQVLQGLRSPVSFMMSGAHPDDEMSPMMAALYMRDGVNLSYTCSTRGEGGQNDLGTERGAVLGALRTAEMEAACDRLLMQMFWLSEGPLDPISDWRFSKSGHETLAVWGHERTLARFVHVLRTARPDMLCPTFLDVPGQHGHHRAMTQLAHEAYAAAADPAYRGSDLPVWEVAKLYLPAWSGAGRAYDDDLPPPPETVRVAGQGSDPVTGWSYGLLGAMSHGQHRSQGMGRLPTAERDFPLHLAESRVGADRGAITDNLPHSFEALGLGDIQPHIDEMIAHFADSPRVLRLARALFSRLEAAETPGPDHHRIARAKRQLARVIALAKGPLPRPQVSASWLCPGARAKLSPAQPLALPDGWAQEGAMVGPTEAARPEDGYRDSYDPLDPPLPAVALSDPESGSETRVPLDRPLMARPAQSVTLKPPQLMLNLAAGVNRGQSRIAALSPSGATPEIAAPTGWSLFSDGAELICEVPPNAPEHIHTLPLLLDGTPAHSVQAIDHPHIRATQSVTPATLRVSVLRAAPPDHPVGYIGADLDQVPERLSELGVSVVDLSAQPLSPDTLAPLKSLIIGIHAMRFNPALIPALPALHSWIAGGGRLVTLYHRPWDSWDPETTPPRRLQIGEPSLRWRVTDKDAQVHILEPDHPLFTGPNPISPADFNGWDKERGLYFASDWDPAYTPLVALADPDEDLHRGALLVAEIGRGSHIHVALNLHHQLDQMVPGAIRLLLNLIAT